LGKTVVNENKPTKPEIMKTSNRILISTSFVLLLFAASGCDSNKNDKGTDDIGDAIKPYYGDDAGKKLTALLHDHITISADVVKAAKANDKKALDDANKKWSDNADEISDFLSKANPNWKLDDMKKMMHDHLKLTTDEAVSRIKKDYDADVNSYDKVHDEILKMADMLTDGIIKQFPDKF
jgi:hypothetical protein